MSMLSLNEAKVNIVGLHTQCFCHINGFEPFMSSLFFFLMCSVIILPTLLVLIFLSHLLLYSLHISSLGESLSVNEFMLPHSCYSFSLLDSPALCSSN